MDSKSRTPEEMIKQLRTNEEVEDYLKTQIGEKGKITYFYQYLNQYVGEKNMSISQVISSSRINKNYVYHITNGSKKRPGRDKIIALCFGAAMTYEEINKGLETGGYCRLNPEDARDVWISVCANRRQYDVLSLNLLLEQHGLQPLDI